MADVFLMWIALALIWVGISVSSSLIGISQELKRIADKMPDQKRGPS